MLYEYTVKNFKEFIEKHINKNHVGMSYKAGRVLDALSDVTSFGRDYRNLYKEDLKRWFRIPEQRMRLITAMARLDKCVFYASKYWTRRFYKAARSLAEDVSNLSIRSLMGRYVQTAIGYAAEVMNPDNIDDEIGHWDRYALSVAVVYVSMQLYEIMEDTLTDEQLEMIRLSWLEDKYTSPYYLETSQVDEDWDWYDAIFVEPLCTVVWEV